MNQHMNNMQVFGIRIELLDDVVLSASAATEGEHQTLDYISGSALMGWAARLLYSKLKEDESWSLFHSGLVQFGDGVPLSADGSPGWPVPLSLHYPKDTPLAEIDQETRNLARGGLRADAQPEQRRNLYVTSNGKTFSIRSKYRLRTAIAGSTGRADDGRLFGYASIARGASFLATISANRSITASITELLDCFRNCEIRLGRAKGSEYGRAKTSVVEAPLPVTGVDWQNGEDVQVWLLSDMLLQDEFGLPTLEPLPGHFGLSDGEVDWSRTFLRFRTWAPWNGALKARLTDRQVLSRGSVIFFQNAKKEANSAAHVTNGLEYGHYAKFVVEPTLLADKAGLLSLTKTNPAIADLASPAPLTQSEAAYQAWAIGIPRSETLPWAMGKIAELKSMYQSAMTLVGAGLTSLGPSPTQWGTVLEAAKASQSLENLRRRLFGAPGKPGLIDHDDDAWTADVSDKGRFSNFRNWLSDCIDQAEKDAPSLAIIKVRRLAEEARRLAISLRDGRESQINDAGTSDHE